jgi:hypothetical protein
MKRILTILLLLMLTSCSKYSQLRQVIEFDGETYTICTYSTGLFNIPKGAFHLETQTKNPQELSNIKKYQWEIAKEFVDNY